jgi:hypothetical protein
MRAPGSTPRYETTLSFRSKSCLPMTPELPFGTSGDFGTSPFLGSASDKPLLPRVSVAGDAEGKDNSSWKI